MPCKREKLLIVDDEPSIRISISQVLAEIGYRVRLAEDGFSALREIHRESPDIVLSDLNMPGMSGFELLSVVRRRFPAILVIAMSGAFSGNEVPSGVAADAFYSKGSSMGALLQILGTLHPVERRPLQHGSTVAPLWIQRSANNSPTGMAQATICCPECLRSTTKPFGDLDHLTRQVNCVHCGNSIQYTIVEPAGQMELQAIQHNTAANAPPSTSTFSS
jgi:CheY-like chemotaxis protein